MRVALWLALPCLCFAADQTSPGKGNRTAQEIARRSLPVQAALAILHKAAAQIRDQPLQSATRNALSPAACVLHRAGLTASAKSGIVEALVAAGLADPADAAKFPGGLMAGIFPPLLEDGGACPKLPQAFEAAPGSSFGGHHSYPGGLAIHEAFNLQSSMNLASLYQRTYGPALPLNRDLLMAAAIWHDWAKVMVFQWNADGTEFAELNFGGSAKVDSKTGAHHILGLAEAMRQTLPPDEVIAQASAHAAPVLGNEPKVVNWLRAAAMVARIDPVDRGYLVRNSAGDWHLPHLLPEYSIHNLSDADFVVSVPAGATADSVLKQLAREYGYSADDPTRYNTHYRNPALSQLTSERILIVYANSGLDGVKAELNKLRAARKI